MKVSELLRQLKQYPDDTDVAICDGENGVSFYDLGQFSYNTINGKRYLTIFPDELKPRDF